MINYIIDHVTPVFIKITDAGGRLMISRNLTGESTGKHHLNINTKNFASGTYYVELKTDSDKKIQLVQVQK